MSFGQYDLPRSTLFWQKKLVSSSHVRGGHHKLIMRGEHCKLIQFSQTHYIKWHNIWLTLFTHYPINQEWCRPLATTSLVQAVPPPATYV